MPIFVGGTEITDIQIGNGDGTSTEINEVYVGANKVWQRSLATYTMVAGSSFNRHSYSDQGGTTYQDTYLDGFISGTFGSMSPTTFSLSGGNPSIYQLRDYRLHEHHSEQSWQHNTYNSRFTVNGSVSNSGWTTITVNGVTKTRASASYSQSGGQTTWEWSDRWLPSSGTHDVIFN